MSIQIRLKKFITFKNLTPKEFEVKTGLANAAASRIGENSRAATFNRIANTFPDLNIDWLKTGEGEMLNARPSVGVDIDLKLGGHSQFAMRDITNIGDAKTAILHERIKSLENEINEKNKRIDELCASLERERMMNDYLMRK